MPMPSTLNKYFRETYPGAPQITGQPGSVIAALDAFLLTGYGATALDGITVAGTVATATVSSHPFVEDQVLILSGVDQSGYNGEIRIYNVSAGQFSFTVASGTASPATGSLSAKVAPQGNWEKAYSGTNLAVYRSTDASGLRFYLRIDDSNAQYAIATGYESMASVSVGTNPFPPAGTTVYWKKSSTADGTARPYHFAVDSRGFEFYVAWLAGSSTVYERYVFNELMSFKPGDAFHAFIGGSNTTVLTNVGHGSTTALVTVSPINANDANYGTGYVSHFLARDYNQIAGSTACSQYTEYAAWYQSGDYIRPAPMGRTLTGSNGGRYMLPFPDPVSGGVVITRLLLGKPSAFRGVQPGVWEPLHNAAFSPADTVAGKGVTEGDILIPIYIGGYCHIGNIGFTYGQILLQKGLVPWRYL